MKLTAIMAVADGDVIGQNGTMPWNLTPDMKRLKQLTTGHAVIMGRKTYASIGRPLPNRTNIVVSRSTGGLEVEGADGVIGTCDPDEALRIARSRDDNPFVIGGAQIWSALWKHVTHVELTRIHLKVEPPEGTVVFGFHVPLWEQEWVGPRETHEGLDYQFMRYRRIAPDSSLDAGSR